MLTYAVIVVSLTASVNSVNERKFIGDKLENHRGQDMRVSENVMRSGSSLATRLMMTSIQSMSNL